MHLRNTPKHEHTNLKWSRAHLHVYAQIISNVIKRMSSYFIASSESTTLTLAKLPLLMLGGQDSLHFFLRRSHANKQIPGEKTNSYIRMWHVYELCMSKESVLPASCSVNVLSQCPSMWAFRVKIPPRHKLLPLTRLLYVCCKSCFKSRLCTCSRTGKPKLGTWGKKQAAICSQRITEIVSYNSH